MPNWIVLALVCLFCYLFVSVSFFNLFLCLVLSVCVCFFFYSICCCLPLSVFIFSCYWLCFVSSASTFVRPQALERAAELRADHVLGGVDPEVPRGQRQLHLWRACTRARGGGATKTWRKVDVQTAVVGKNRLTHKWDPLQWKEGLRPAVRFLVQF